MTFDIVGGYLEKELTYEGETEQEIAEAVMKDENDLLYYMRTEDDCGEKAFVFRGFMFKKSGLLAAQMREPEY